MGIGDWGLGIGDWGLGPSPNRQSPIPNPQSPIPNPQSTRPLFILIKLTILLNIRDTLKNNINYNSFGIKN